MSNTELKPTNEDIARYIAQWIDSFDGQGLVVTENIGTDAIMCLGGDFLRLRKMFVPDNYDSIQEYVDKTKEEN